MDPVGGTVILIVATRALTLERDGVDAGIGDTVQVRPVIAAALTYQQKARFVTGNEPAKRKRGRPKGSTYQRRDLTAESPEGTE